MLRVLTVGLLLTATICVADEPTRFKLAAPQGWGGETIDLPPRFAPDMKLKGAEHIRFAPGMMKADADSFFSYAFAFELQPQPELSEAVVSDEFLKYYRGLCKAVLRGNLPDVDPAGFTLKLQREMAAQPAAGAEAVAVANRYRGTLEWVEPFVTKKPQKLNLEIWTWNRNARNYVFACVSPQPSDAPIWPQLRKIRDDYWKQ